MAVKARTPRTPVRQPDQLFSLTHEEAMATHIVFKTADMGGSPQTDAVSPITLKLIKHTRT